MIIKLIVFINLVLPVSARIRNYYIAAVEIDWNYVPSGTNLVKEPDQDFLDRTERRIDRIGSIYRKVVFRGFTDSSFTKPIPREPWEGIVGPTIKAEIGDTVYVHFRNMATRQRYSVHPHGFLYSKSNEGALHLDKTSGTDKYDDAVPPGAEITYTWLASDIHAPTADDDKCNTWGYHSHVRAHRDIDTGLVGMIVICRKGFLTPDGRRKDVDRELVLYSDIANENDNWYIEENLNRCGDPATCRQLREQDNGDFSDSNDFYHINGYAYGNLPGYNVCEGERVAWYIMSLNLGVHTIHINGQTMVIERKRTDTATINSGTFVTGYMTPTNPGRWLIYCRNSFHFTGGMQAFLNIQRCPGVPYSTLQDVQTHRRVREYYIAIEEIIWDYAPNFKTDKSSVITFLKQDTNRIGSLYKKAVFREYRDKMFKARKTRGIHEKHYGLAGPPIVAEVGDHVVVFVLNKASRPYSLLANGVTIDKRNEGAFYKQNPNDRFPTGNVVSPGDIKVYEFDITKGNSPMPLDEDCLTYSYHSAVDVQRDIYTGLFGPLLVCKQGSLTKSGFQKGADRDFFLNWMVIDENLSWYIDHNIQAFTRQPRTVNKENAAFRTSNQIRTINGRSFGTLEGLQMCLGEKVYWHMYGLGERFDHHHFGFESNNFRHDGRQIDTTSVFPGVGKTVVMVPDQAGHHLLRSGQLRYEFEGLYAWYNVMVCKNHKLAVHGLPPSLVPNIVGVVRRYFIAAVEGDWEYCPKKRSHVNGESLWNPEGDAYRFIRGGSNFVGSVYRKAFYRQYTDETFSRLIPRGPEEEHLGILGDYIKGNAGDTIEIIFKNMASHPYNLVPRNVVFADGSPISMAPATMPGDITMYTYVIPERSAPTDNEPNCVGTSYSSRVNPMNDTYAGLFGPMVICKPGILDVLGHRHDGVTKEFAVAFVIIDENLSNYKDYNFRTRAPGRSNYSESDFINSNRYFSINGLIYANLNGLVFNEGEQTAWYVFGVGSIFGIHTAHIHGQVYVRSTSLTLKRDVLEVFSGTHETVEMLGYNPGTWLLHCHVSLHAQNGMTATYTVRPRRPNRYNQDYNIRSSWPIPHKHKHYPVKYFPKIAPSFHPHPPGKFMKITREAESLSCDLREYTANEN